MMSKLFLFLSIFVLSSTPPVFTLNDDDQMMMFQQIYHKNFTTKVHPEVEDGYPEALETEDWISKNIWVVVLCAVIYFLLHVIAMLVCCICNLMKNLEREQEEFELEVPPPVIQMV